MLRRVGHFVPAGVPLLVLSRADRLTTSVAATLFTAFDIGPTRTLQQDVEFVVLQIVDIALKAISPAVNDPSTAITCLDQLSRIVIRWVSRYPPEMLLMDPPHVVRVVMPMIGFEGLIDTAFEQIRHYSSGDLAVSARLLRVLDDIATSTSDPAVRAILAGRAARVYDGCRGRLDDTALETLRRRLVQSHEQRGVSLAWPAG